MFKQAAKKAIKGILGPILRPVIHFVRNLDDESRISPNFPNDDFAYRSLNSIMMQILREGEGLRPHFIWGVVYSAFLAKSIGVNCISVIEFGVAGGNGLISLEKVAEKVEKAIGVSIDVYGFDTGIGLPKPTDYRDMPNLWAASAFPMDVDKLKQRLTRAQINLGLLKDTIPRFINSRPAPIAFASIDVDYHSSTMDAFGLFDADEGLLLPRVHCYFDDIMGFTNSEFNGERLAIDEFNSTHKTRKISPIYGLKYFLPGPFFNAKWSEQMYLAHFFDHSLYGHHDGLVKRFVGDGTALKN